MKCKTENAAFHQNTENVLIFVFIIKNELKQIKKSGKKNSNMSFLSSLYFFFVPYVT